MFIECLTISFQLPGCDSLKEKRQRMSGLKSKIGKWAEVAMLESGSLNTLDSSEWSFFIVGGSNKQVDQTIQRIEKTILETVDARVQSVNRERI